MSWILRKFKQKEDTENVDKTTYMMRNGETVLKKLIASSNGKYNPYRIFSVQEIKLATNNYDSKKILISEGFFILYKGFWQDRFISVMKFYPLVRRTYCINNIVYTSQMIHKHILQLIGCCLDTEVPILVFESVEFGTLTDRIYGNTQFEPLSLKQRLKIAMDIANALAYIHLGFLRPIVFGDLSMSHVLLDEQNTAKLFDFSRSITIPEGETHVTTDWLLGTYPYNAPEYERTLALNEKSDVHNFGVFLIGLLTKLDIRTFFLGLPANISVRDHIKEYFEENRDNEILDPLIAEDRSSSSIDRLAVERLIFECVNDSPVDRAPMIDVAKRLRQMYRSCTCT